MSTERENLEKIQKAIGAIKKAAREEIARAKAAEEPEHLNAWCKVYHKIGLYHTEMTDLGLEHFPEFFGKLVIAPMGGGGGR